MLVTPAPSSDNTATWPPRIPEFAMNTCRVGAGLLLVLGLVAWTAMDVRKTLVKQRKALENVKLEVIIYEENCAAIRDQLPDRGRVGYRDFSKDPFPDSRHALVQYSLV